MSDIELDKTATMLDLRDVNERLLLSALREQDLASTLERERALLDAILSSIGDAVLVVDREGRPVLTNAAYMRMTGDPDATLVLENAAGQTVPPEDAPWRRAARGDDFIQEFSTPNSDGTRRWWEAHGRPIGHDPDVQGGVVVIRDINERKLLEKELHYQALHDGLTGLPNRTLLYDRLGQALLSEQRTEDPLALFLLDLDHFKGINDTLGHHAGDLLLREISDRLLHTLRAVDTVARLGGDEFAVLMPRTDGDGALEVAGRIRASLELAIMIDGQPVYVTASIGIALSSGRGIAAQELLRQADIAMYTAKRTQSGYALYTTEFGAESDRAESDRMERKEIGANN